MGLLWARQYWYSVDVALAAFGLREGLLFLFVKFLFQAPFLVNGLIVEGTGS